MDNVETYSDVIVSTRISIDSSCDKRGTRLIEFFNDEGLIILNGRMADDIPSQLTHHGARGSSTIDFAACTRCFIDTIRSFSVLSIPTSSDHQPIVLTLLHCPPSPLRTLTPPLQISNSHEMAERTVF